MAGVEPWPFSLRELVWIAEGRQRTEWDRSLIIAQCIVNAAPNFGKRKRKPPNMFAMNPYRKNARRTRGIPLRGERGTRVLEAIASRSGNGQQYKGDQGG